MKRSPRRASPKRSPAARADVAGRDAQLALDSLRRIVRAQRTPAADHGELSPAGLFVLQTLAAGGTLSVNELAERTHTHQSSVSVVVKRLAQMQLVRRTRSAGDARRAELSVTPLGVARLRSAPRAPQTRLFDAIDALPPAVRSQLAKSLDALVGRMGLRNGAARMFFEDEPQRRGARRSRSART